MKGSWDQTGARILAVVILLSMATDLLLKNTADLQEGLWSCYWASLAVAIGILTGVTRLVACGLVFFLGLGLPAWIVARVVDRQLEPTSVLLHVVPPAAALLYASRLEVLPKFSGVAAWMLHAVPLALASIVTDPLKNINLAQSVWPPLSSFVPQLWQFHIAILSISACTLTATTYAFNRALKRYFLAGIQSRIPNFAWGTTAGKSGTAELMWRRHLPAPDLRIQSGRAGKLQER